MLTTLHYPSEVKKHNVKSHLQDRTWTEAFFQPTLQPTECDVLYDFVDTVEVCGSSPHGPTIFFSDLASTTLLDQAPIGSIKEVLRDSEGSSRFWVPTVEKDAAAS